MADPQTTDIQALQTRINADPRVQQAYAAYLKNKSQPNFIAYLDALKPHMASLNQDNWGINPATGEIQGTSNYGHPWKIAVGMAAGAAGAYGPWANAGANAANQGVQQVGTGDLETPGTANVDGPGNLETPGTVNLPSGGSGGDGGWSWDSTLGRWVQKQASQAAGSGMDDLIRSIPGLAALIPALMASRQTDEEKKLTSTQNDILGLQKQRMASQQPLFDSAQRGLMGMLPTWMRGNQ